MVKTLSTLVSNGSWHNVQCFYTFCNIRSVLKKRMNLKRLWCGRWFVFSFQRFSRNGVHISSKHNLSSDDSAKRERRHHEFGENCCTPLPLNQGHIAKPWRLQQLLLVVVMRMVDCDWEVAAVAVFLETYLLKFAKQSRIKWCCIWVLLPWIYEQNFVLNMIQRFIILTFHGYSSSAEKARGQ